MSGLRGYRYEEYQMSPFTNTRDKTCEIQKLGFKVHVKIGDLNNAMGEWSSFDDTVTIAPNGLDVDTISHESFHIVKTISRRYGIKREELLAWAQGGMTNCIVTILLKDEKIPETPMPSL